MVRLKDILDEGNLFNEISIIKQYPFVAGNEIVLNSLLTITHGNKTVYEPYESLTLEEIANILIVLLNERWEQYTLIADIKAQPFDEATLDETIDGVSNNVNTREDLNKVSAFNTEDLITNDGTSVNSSDDLTKTDTKTSTQTNKDKLKAYNMLLDSEKNVIISKVLKDISDTLTLSIY